jgi:hypothetical protein
MARAARCVILGVVVWGLACAGPAPEPAPEPTDPWVAGPRGVPPSGKLEPVWVVETKETRRRCRLERTQFPGRDTEEIQILEGDCPKQAMLTWRAGGLLLKDEEGALRPWSGHVVPAPPHPVDFASYDSAGTLHACGFYRTPIQEGVAYWDGQVIKERLGGPGPVVGVYASWTLQGGRWTHRSAYQGPAPESTLECYLRLQLADTWGHWASSHHRGYGPLDWFTQHPDDMAALAALGRGQWYTEDQRLVATNGALWQEVAGPVALWVGERWKIVHAGHDVAALWMRRDWIALRTTKGEFELISRRNGEVVYQQPEETLAFLWPEEAPAP